MLTTVTYASVASYFIYFLARFWLALRLGTVF